MFIYIISLVNFRTLPRSGGGGGGGRSCDRISTLHLYSPHIDHKDITITFNYLGEVLFPMDIEQTLFVFQISYQDII